MPIAFEGIEPETQSVDAYDDYEDTYNMKSNRYSEQDLDSYIDEIEETEEPEESEEPMESEEPEETEESEESEESEELTNQDIDATVMEHMPDTKLQAEYDAAFEGTELVENKLRDIAGKVKLYPAEVLVDELVLNEFKKESRIETRIGLDTSIQQWKVLTPIHVMKLEDKAYMVLDGLRRLHGVVRNGIEKVPCIVWDFEDKIAGKRLFNILALMLNHTEAYTVTEQWGMYQRLEEVNNATPALIEYLLGLQAGQAMKLKDIMLCEEDYAEVKDRLIEGKTDIDGAYRKLCNLRKKEQRLDKEDKMAAVDSGTDNEVDVSKKLTAEEADAKLEIGKSYEHSDMEIGEPEIDIPEDVEIEETELEDTEVQDLLDQADAIKSDAEADADVSVDSLMDIDKTSELRQQSVYQKVGQRHPIDKELRLGTFMRDGFKCRCCGLGGNEAYLAVLAFHHAIPVFAGGPDTKENGLTLCVNCHILLHTYLQGKLALDMATIKDSIEVQKFKRIMEFGNIALEACKKGHISKTKMQKAMESETKHPRPETYIGENTKLYATAETLQKAQPGETEETEETEELSAINEENSDFIDNEDTKSNSGFSVKLISD